MDDEQTFVVVCAPRTITLRSVRYCPTCERRRRMVDVFAVWYGFTSTCCACGDSWGDGERLPRPFCRGWRAKESAKARRRWDAAPKRAVAKAQMRHMLADEFRLSA